MASIHEIVENEHCSGNTLFLHREGIFWKAYQQSAYRAISRVGKLKVSKRYIKVAGVEVASVGFPESTLVKHFSDNEIVRQEGGKLIEIHSVQTDMSGYECWFASLTTDDRVQGSGNASVDGLNSCERAVLRKLREFSIEESTPMQSMNFLASIRKELAC